jgi:beta-galactosidase
MACAGRKKNRRTLLEEGECNVKFEARGSQFWLDGKSFYLYSGEVQYFRIARDRWDTHLRKLKDAGANTVSTYIPWSWHEIKEGEFDFTGRTHPQRDLLGFLDAVARAGLYVSVKPGPYILAEFDDRGIPTWLTDAHPEIQARGVDMITYLHPTFQAYALKWFDAVLPLLAERQITRNGPLILMQVCNEVGLYNWLGGAGDASPVSLAHFRAWLRKRYRTIAALNTLYGSRYRSFTAVPAPSRPTRSPGEFVSWNDWHDYHRWYYAEYLDWLIAEMRRQGIDVQLFHNIPGWVYGRGTEYPVNITFYAETVRRHPELTFGVDHIPENPNYRNCHDDLIINEMVRALQGGAQPVWAVEQQAGTREHQVHTFPRELELFYKACLGRGLAGMNLYMFSQGINPPGRGTFGPTFYWRTALSHDGEELPLYPVVKKIGRLLQTYGDRLLASRRSEGVGVVFYQPYYHDEFLYPLFGGVPKLDVARAGLRYDPKTLRNTYYFEGLLRMLVLQNRDFEMLDVQTTVPDPARLRQLWVVAGERMDRRTQERLADYVVAGGHLMLWPGFPERDLQMRPCAVLRKRLGIQEGPVWRPAGVAKVEILGQPDINVLSPVRTFSAPDAQVIAQTPGQGCCGLTHKVGKGKVTVLGTIFTYNIQEQLAVFAKLAGLGQVQPAVDVSAEEVLAHVRYGEDGSFLTLLNYTPEPQTVIVKVRVADGQEVTIPEKGTLTLEPVSGLLLPWHYTVGSQGQLIWTSAEILSLTGEAGRIRAEIQPSPRHETNLVWRLSNPAVQVRWKNRDLGARIEQGLLRIELPASAESGSLEILLAK